MNEIVSNLIENSKLAYKKSILLGDEELEELLLSILTDTKKLQDEANSKKQNKTSLLTERTEEEEIDRVKRKIPSWFSKPNQYNHKILVAFLKLSNKNETSVNLNDLEKASGMDPHKFKTNFNQMKIISYKNHGKVFSELNENVTLWEPLAKYIVNEYEKIEVKNGI